ncbi:MAG: Nucleopolyhedrovirus protein [Acidobacteriota bacterium]|jgi:chromosome segregation ATPase|nr:Nucleopolyhedrovirus protein [Acidobacteriota bacterium]
MSNQQPEENRNMLNFIASTVEMIRDRMATKDDIVRLDARIENLEVKVDSLAVKVDSLAVKVDSLEVKVDNLEVKVNRLEVKVDRLEVETTIIRGEVEQVHLRLDGIERTLASRLVHVETEMSRLRSVLYLLVKDRPDMLRLLGQTPPPGG